MLLTLHEDDGYIAGRPEAVRKTLDWIKQEVEILEIGSFRETPTLRRTIGPAEMS